MNKAFKWVMIALVLVGVIIWATVLYNEYSDDYKMQNPVQTTQNPDDSQAQIVAPDFTVLDYNGNEVKLSDYKGKPVVLNFWATWCYYCKEEMPDFNEAYKKYPDVQFLMVNATDGYQETMKTAKEYIESEKYEFDVFFDTEIEAVNAYYVSGFPATFFIDKDGNLTTYVNGMIESEALEKGIELIRE